MMQQIVEKLRTESIANSTKRSYHSAWKSFNNFFIRLDEKPDNWEDRLILFIGFLIQERKQSQTIRSYVSAIKKVLSDDGITLNENRLLIRSLTKACKFKNDKVRTRLPIRKGMLRIILKSTEDYFETAHQPFLSKLYRALFSTAYFGLLRVGELTKGEHPILVNDVHLAANKRKFLFILRSSKTHGRFNKPQQVKICSNALKSTKHPIINRNTLGYCPYRILQQYVDARPAYRSSKEPFFVFGDRSDVRPENMRKTLKMMLKISGFNDKLYNIHSFRAGRACRPRILLSQCGIDQKNWKMVVQ